MEEMFLKNRFIPLVKIRESSNSLPAVVKSLMIFLKWKSKKTFLNQDILTPLIKGI